MLHVLTHAIRATTQYWFVRIWPFWPEETVWSSKCLWYVLPQLTFLTMSVPRLALTEMVPEEMTGGTSRDTLQNGHLLCLPPTRFKRLNMTQGQFARHLNKKPLVAVFLPDDDNDLFLKIQQLFPDAILVEHNQKLEQYQQTNSTIEARIYLGNKIIETIFQISSSLCGMTFDHKFGILVPFTVCTSLPFSFFDWVCSHPIHQ